MFRSAMLALVLTLVGFEAVAQTLHFEVHEVDLGMVADTVGVQTCVLEFENVGDRVVELTGVRTSCSCLSATVSVTRLAPSEKGQLTLSFKPHRMAGEVAATAGICLDGSVLADFEVLLKAQVQISDRWYYLPVRLGSLALKRDEVVATKGEVTRIVCANIAGEPLSPSVEVRSEGIEAWFEPLEIAPVCEADLVVRVGSDCKESVALLIIKVGDQTKQIVLNLK